MDLAPDASLAGKDALRASILAKRQSRVAQAPDLFRDFQTLSGLANPAAASQPSQVWAIYASVPPEPDTWPLITAAYEAGIDVLLPVLGSQPNWARYAGPDQLRASWRGILEPTTPALGPEALRAADLIIVSGLAGTPQGDRLGTGGGWYDRALAWASPQAQKVLLLYEGEIFDELPTDPWDVRVDSIATAG
ncbi:MAG: 5-formyltetrahydrofolate cyclo-ligase [Propionibacteriaceae bacterium]|jgi:5-formyltetrahydrofolate cyclo-ligase|nr:5-formyltetrahydrofolate cyclo-ligase [Propionibacteriaceae bacterium]